MKIRLVVAIARLAISFALPTFAQEKDTVDPKTIEQIRVLAAKYDEAFTNGDAAALAAAFTGDAVLVNDTGPVYGREAIEKHFADVFKQVHVSNHIGQRDQYSPHILGTGNEIWANGEWSLTVKGPNWGPKEVKGFWSAVHVLEGDVWKNRMVIGNTTPAPAATPSPTATPSNE